MPAALYQVSAATPSRKAFPDYLPSSSSAVSDQAWCPPHEQGRPGYSTDPDIQAGLALPTGLLGGERSGVRLRIWWLNQKLPPSWLLQAQPPRVMGPGMKRKRLARQPLGGALRAAVCCHTASIQENTVRQPSLGPVPFKEVQSCGWTKPAGKQSARTTSARLWGSANRLQGPSGL